MRGLERVSLRMARTSKLSSPGISRSRTIALGCHDRSRVRRSEGSSVVMTSKPSIRATLPTTEAVRGSSSMTRRRLSGIKTFQKRRRGASAPHDITSSLSFPHPEKVIQYDNGGAVTVDQSPGIEVSALEPIQEVA